MTRFEDLDWGVRPHSIKAWERSDDQRIAEVERQRKRVSSTDAAHSLAALAKGAGEIIRAVAEVFGMFLQGSFDGRSRPKRISRWEHDGEILRCLFEVCVKWQHRADDNRTGKPQASATDPKDLRAVNDPHIEAALRCLRSLDVTDQALMLLHSVELYPPRNITKERSDGAVDVISVVESQSAVAMARAIKAGEPHALPPWSQLANHPEPSAALLVADRMGLLPEDRDAWDAAAATTAKRISQARKEFRRLCSEVELIGVMPRWLLPAKAGARQAKTEARACLGIDVQAGVRLPCEWRATTERTDAWPRCEACGLPVLQEVRT